MVVIRLSRTGKKNHPVFRFVVSDRRKDTHGRYLELLGWYDPHAQPAKIELNVERAKHWLSLGAQASDTVYNLLVEKGAITGAKRKFVKPKKKATAETSATPPAPIAA
jgi:small subunit ribosomal protein S16